MIVGDHVTDSMVGPMVGVFVLFVGDDDGLMVTLVGESVGGGVGFLVVGDLVGLFVVVVGDVDGESEVPFRVGATEGL